MSFLTGGEKTHEFSHSSRSSFKFILNAAFDKRVSLPVVAATPNEMSTGMDLH